MGRIITGFLASPLLGSLLFMGLLGLAAYPLFLLVALYWGFRFFFSVEN